MAWTASIWKSIKTGIIPMSKAKKTLLDKWWKGLKWISMSDTVLHCQLVV